MTQRNRLQQVNDGSAPTTGVGPLSLSQHDATQHDTDTQGSDPQGSRRGSRVYTLTEADIRDWLWLAVSEYARITRETGTLWSANMVAQTAVNNAIVDLRRACE